MFAVLWLVLICCEKKVLLGGWCWFGVREKYYWLDAVNRMNSFKNFCGVQRFKIISISFAPASYFLFVERT